jgi:hypothetical protein
MTEYLDPDDNPPAIISLENYTFLTRKAQLKEGNVFGSVLSEFRRGISNAQIVGSFVARSPARL